MSVKFTDLQCKEVICVNDGRRLGFIKDIQLGIPEGEVLAIVVPGPCRMMGLLGHRDDYLIPWRCIRRIGPEIVLVDAKIEECRVPRNKCGWLFS
ncbi:MAG: YlmC/YmxH family sporulation protein [Oscillospiraceae bacterium]|nr:YlmC/YmxH family sporulation protein [Oscillospiraceae bacterium]